MRRVLRIYRENAHIRTEKVNALYILEQSIMTKKLSLRKEVLKNIKNYIAYSRKKQVNQEEAVRQIKRLKKTIDYKVMQRFIIQWKLNTIDNKQQ